MRGVLALLALFPAAAFAQAADAGASPMGSPLTNMLPLLLIFAVFYFLLIKPQQQRMKELKATLGALKKGDKIVTAGGIIGKVTKLNDENTITVEIASGVEVSVVKSTVTGLVDAPVVTAPAPKADKKKGGNKNDNAAVSRDSVANDN